VRALAIVHESDTGPGVFIDAVRVRGWELDTWLIATDPDPPADPSGYDAVLTFGGAQNADEENRNGWLRTEGAILSALLDGGVPLLGVCLGAQLLCQAAGGEVARAREPEIGWYAVGVEAAADGDPVIGALPPRFDALQWHSYECRLPAGATVLATSPRCLQAFRIGEAAWGIQFHAEVTLADYESWLDNHAGGGGPSIDGDRLRAETRARIAAWNGLGRALCGRFLDAATGLRPRP
jgi:GMP synthase-like glutamine amidotransferase